ncbi:hypothetical protein LJ754_01505 [Arthrobacter sp. zg-Y40]|uniref:hypothetical protein n=1 Tax=Arthrobacter sp. zg-Y40 TaxID=2886939 RepID=UPI001D136FE7|nr:hypothetical protein [Arthrobacter sp. zg-Y40]MCC3277839.1 hypothetical protein [Arthrobacter sp. zg-Y40]
MNTFVLQRYVRIIGARTGQNIGAVTDVVNILVAADQQMSDTAKNSAAQAAQDGIGDDPLADRNAPRPSRPRARGSPVIRPVRR